MADQKTPTPVRTHILRALALGVKYETTIAKQAQDPAQRKARAERAYQLVKAFERVECHKFTTC